MMNIADLPKIEQDAIELLLQSEKATPILRRQLSAATEIRRTTSGAGVYVDFVLGPHAEAIDGDVNFEISDVFAKSSSGNEIGFILFVRNGFVDCLEGFGYTDMYPIYDDNDFSLFRQEPRQISE